MPTRFEVLRDEALACTSCKLAGLGRTQVVFGMGDPAADLVFVGEGPGVDEDKQGLPFVGRSGKLLDRLMLEELGITRDAVYIANVVKCRPPNNRDPEPDEIETCRPYLEQQLELIDPKVVVTLGNFAAQLLLGTKRGITQIRGQSFPFRTGVLIPTLHPAFALRGGGEPLAKMRADFIRAKQALSRPRADARADAEQHAPELATPPSARSKRKPAAATASDPAATMPASAATIDTVPAEPERRAAIDAQPGLFD